MQKNWVLHILAHKDSAAGIAPTYTVGIHPANQRMAEGGAIPTVHFPSWENLATALDAVGVQPEYVDRVKSELDGKGSCHIPEMWLDEAGARKLGFTPDHIPAAAFS